MASRRPEEIFVERLKALIPEGEGRAIATRAGISEAMLSRWRTGSHRPNLRLETLYRFAQALRVPVASLISEEGGTAPVGFEKMREDFVALPASVGRVGAGPARLESSDETRLYAFHKDWIRRTGRKPENLVVVRVVKGHGGESMEPIIRPGSILVVDRGPGGGGFTELPTTEQGKIFLVRHPDEEGMKVKRVYRADSALVLVSDNPATQPRAEVVALKGRRMQDVLLGRVVWVGREED